MGGGNLLYEPWRAQNAFEESRGYDIAFTCEGVPTSSQVVLRFVAVRPFTFPVGLSGSKGKAGTAATAQTVFDIQVNAISKGSITFAAAGTVPTFTFTSAVNIVEGDLVTVIAPSSADSSIAGIAVTLLGAF